MNLQDFCIDPGLGRPQFENPFSWGECTYATNGHIALRVSRRKEIAEHAKAGKACEALFGRIPECEFVPAPKIILPKPTKGPCVDCYGGNQHICPCCNCKCKICAGTGIKPRWHDVSFQYGPAIFDAYYLAKIKDFTGLKFGNPSKDGPMRFAFEGGDGVLMPRTHQKNVHVKLKYAP